MTSSTGLNRNDGTPLSDWAHVEQCEQVIFTTRIGSRVMRRTFGSAVPGILGKNLVPSTMLKFWTAICAAIDLWEPRTRVTNIDYPRPPNSASTMAAGQLSFQVVQNYMPDALQGDFTVSPVPQTLTFGG